MKKENVNIFFAMSEIMLSTKNLIAVQVRDFFSCQSFIMTRENIDEWIVFVHPNGCNIVEKDKIFEVANMLATADAIYMIKATKPSNRGRVAMIEQIK